MAKGAPLKDLLESAGSRYQLVLAWDPGRGQPVGISFIRVGDALLLHDVRVWDSPLILAHLPDPTDSAYSIRWEIAMEVPLRSIVLGLIDTTTGARKKLDGKTNQSRGDVWANEVTVNVPFT